MLLSAQARGEVSGVIFVDANGNGRFDTGEVGRPDVAVSNGLHLVRSDDAGRYALPDRGSLVSLTRPAGFDADPWYREGGGDFALVPRDDPSEFFFIQISDAHVYDRVSDYADFSTPVPPWYVPQWAADWYAVGFLDRIYRRWHPDGAMSGPRQALAPYREVASLGDVAVFRAYSDEFARPGSELGNVVPVMQAAFSEVAALEPSFVVATGDHVLDGNTADPATIQRWFRFYGSLSEGLGVPVYNTIGNNEISGIQNREYSPNDEDYGKYYYRQFLGPSHYSFDRGAYHFVALDTHTPAPTRTSPRLWDMGRMPFDVRIWLDADLAEHSHRVLVVLNHEPFQFDREWPFEPRSGITADDEGILAAAGVRYTLSGHTHFRSFLERGGTTHITAGSLSGLRWFLPASLHERGYGLLYARDGELYSVWKRTGERVIARALGGPIEAVEGELVIAASDVAAPFASLSIERGSEPVSFEPWGRVFARVLLDGEHTGPLVVTATTASGETVVVELETAEDGGD